MPTPQIALGIVLISLGIVSIAFVQRRKRIRRAPRAGRFANAAIIAVYTLVDGAGARASGNALPTLRGCIFLEGIPFLAWIVARRGTAGARATSRAAGARGLVGGAAASARTASCSGR